MSHRVLFDTSSLMYRAFFALPTSITDGEKRPVNAVRGYLDMTSRVLADRRPDEALHVLDDDWRPAPRVQAWPGYKAERRPDPDGLPEQFDLLSEVLHLLGQPVALARGWEADDAIAALCAAAEPADVVEIVTGDRDLLQLVRDAEPTVRVLFTVKGVRELAAFDDAAVRAKYGIPGNRYAEYATLRGDPSDGLPGVRGVGEKTARELIGQYPSLDALLAGLDAQPARLAERLRAASDYLVAMREVVPVRADVDVEVRPGHRDDAALDALAERRRLGGPVERFRAALDGDRR